jgi:hypothetical protein
LNRTARSPDRLGNPVDDLLQHRAFVRSGEHRGKILTAIRNLRSRRPILSAFDVEHATKLREKSGVGRISQSADRGRSG